MRARCPHCRLAVKAKIAWQSPDARNSNGRYRYITLECPSCYQLHIQYASEDMYKGPGALFDHSTWPDIAHTVHPADHGREPVAPEVPPDYAKDYTEACHVLPHSPQSTAALARRLVQALLRGPGGIPQKRSLADEIEEAKTKLPASLWDGLHTLRQMGNFAAHEQRDKGTGVVLPIERHEAEFVLDVVERLFDEYFVGPAKLAAAKAKFNAAKMGPAGKNPVS